MDLFLFLRGTACEVSWECAENVLVTWSLARVRIHSQTAWNCGPSRVITWPEILRFVEILKTRSRSLGSLTWPNKNKRCNHSGCNKPLAVNNPKFKILPATSFIKTKMSIFSCGIHSRQFFGIPQTFLFGKWRSIRTISIFNSRRTDETFIRVTQSQWISITRYQSGYLAKKFVEIHWSYSSAGESRHFT